MFKYIALLPPNKYFTCQISLNPVLMFSGNINKMSYNSVEEAENSIKIDQLETALSKNINEEFGLTKELIEIQFNENWANALKVAKLIIDSDHPQSIHISGEMGSGKSHMANMVKLILEANAYKNKVVQFKLKDGRGYASRCDTKNIQPIEIDVTSSADQILQKIFEQGLNVGDVVTLSEIQFLLGSTLEDIAKSYSLISKALSKAEVHLITDCLKTLASGKQALATMYIRHATDLNNIFDLSAINGIDPSKKPNINMRYVQIYEDGELVFPSIDTRTTGRLARTNKSERLGIVESIKAAIGENNNRANFFRKTTNNKSVFLIPISANDIEYMPGGLERYYATHTEVLFEMLEIIGWSDEIETYKNNIEQSKTEEKKIIAQLAS